MKSPRRVIPVVLLALLIWIGDSNAQIAADKNYPPVTTPPDSFFELVGPKHRDAAREFYKKYLDINGMPVVAAGEVADRALQHTYSIVTHMLAGRPDILDAMIRDRMYLIVIGKYQVYTDMPEYRDYPNPAYQNERVRGTGGRPTSFGEENLLSLPIDRYDDESIGVHEFCHTIDGALRSIDSAWSERRNLAYRNAIGKGLWKNTYAASNPAEYWAEICQSYFDCNRVNNWNHGPIGTRELLKEYDPGGYELVHSTFSLGAQQDWRYRMLQKQPSVVAPPQSFGIDPYYTKFTWAREFTVVGRQASDQALLKANDTIRKMFAYRHDVLKALIADGIKLVVLGRDESVADLPELNDAHLRQGLDPLSRTLEYTPQARLLAVGEESLANANHLRAGDDQVIRVLAKAMYHVTGTRPVDASWDNRGSAVQQYELRVKRLDRRFDEALQELHEQAMSAGKWKGTAAARDRVSYWATGVLAYFDASSRTVVPHDAVQPVATREGLKDYDPNLFSLVDETMAYAGRVDWRLNQSDDR
jgi:hypothetical protein